MHDTPCAALACRAAVQWWGCRPCFRAICLASCKEHYAINTTLTYRMVQPAVRFAMSVGALRAEDGSGTANTSLLYHAGRLMAMHDNDMPYELRLGPDGAIRTVGRLDPDALLSRLREGSSCSNCSTTSSRDGSDVSSRSSSDTVEGPALPPLAAIGAHAKVDPRTGELLFLSNDFQSQPYTVGGVLGPDGYVTHLWPWTCRTLCSCTTWR